MTAPRDSIRAILQDSGPLLPPQESPSATTWQVLASVAHELQTPIRAALSFAERATASANAAELERTLSGIREACARADMIVTNLLEACRPASNHSDVPQPHSVSVDRILASACQGMRLLAKSRNIKLDIEVASDAPKARVDSHALRQAVANLLDNAIRYSYSGRSVRVSLRRAIGDGLILQITNHGLLIPDAELPRHSNVEQGAARRYSSIPVGLAWASLLLTAT